MAPKWLRNGSEWLISYSVAQTSFKFGTDDIYQLSNVQITSWCSLSIFWLHIGSEMAPKWLRMAHFLFYCSDIIQIWHRWCLPVKWCANNVLVFTFYFLAPYWLQNGSEWLFFLFFWSDIIQIWCRLHLLSSLSLSLSLSLTLSHSHSLSLSLALTLSHLHLLSLSYSLCLIH